MISKTTKVPSFNIQIWVGLRVQYSDELYTIKDVEDLVDGFVNEIKDCVTITPTQFRYVDGHEPGVIVGYINYPRFPQPEEELKRRAIELAELLMCGLGQNRVSITTPKATIMLSMEDCLQQGDKLVCLESVKNLLGQPLFEKDKIYSVLHVDDELITLDHNLYGNEYNSFEIDWVLKKFKKVIENKPYPKFVDGECCMCGDIADEPNGHICKDCREN